MSLDDALNGFSPLPGGRAVTRPPSVDTLLRGLEAPIAAPDAARVRGPVVRHSSGEHALAAEVAPHALLPARTDRNAEPAVVLRASLVDEAEMANAVAEDIWVPGTPDIRRGGRIQPAAGAPVAPPPAGPPPRLTPVALSLEKAPPKREVATTPAAPAVATAPLLAAPMALAVAPVAAAPTPVEPRPAAPAASRGAIAPETPRELVLAAGGALVERKLSPTFVVEPTARRRSHRIAWLVVVLLLIALTSALLLYLTHRRPQVSVPPPQASDLAAKPPTVAPALSDSARAVISPLGGAGVAPGGVAPATPGGATIAGAARVQPAAGSVSARAPHASGVISTGSSTPGVPSTVTSGALRPGSVEPEPPAGYRDLKGDIRF
jgi:hypothetical protein